MAAREGFPETRPEEALRNPFGWRECLSAKSSGASPASTGTPRQQCGSARSTACSSRAGSFCFSQTGTPRSAEGSARSLGCSSARPSSARSSDLSRSSVQEDEPGHRTYESSASRKRHNAFTAALDVLSPPEGTIPVPQGTPPPLPPSEVSLEPRQVFSAARHGRHKDVEASLQAGFDPCEADSFGNTLFHVACQNGNKRIAKLAIKYGGNMGAQNVKGNTGLHFLFAYCYHEIAEYFISKGASECILNDAGHAARGGLR